MNGTSSKRNLISVRPKVLTFQFELETQTCCLLEVTNNRLHSVAFKVKTNSPEKYLVRPKRGVIQPWQICLVRVTLKPQKEYPPDMLCKDKFLIQSTIVDPHHEIDDLPHDTFTNDCGWTLEECQVKVKYVYPETYECFKRNYDDDSDVLKRRRDGRKQSPLFSFFFKFLVVVVGFAVGFILKLWSSSSSSTEA